MDIYKIKDTLSTKRFRDTFCAVLVVLFITAEMFVSAANDWDGRLDIINLIGITSKVLFVIIVLRNIPCKSFAVKVYGAFLVWLIVTRPFCRDVTFDGSHGIVMLHIIFFSILLYSFSVDKRMRKMIFIAVSIVYCVFYLAVSVTCIYTAVSHNEASLPFYIDVKLMTDYNTYITVLSRNRNVVARWINMAICFTLCHLFFLCKKRWLQCFLIIVCGIYYVALGTIHSKTSMIATSLVLGMFVALYALDYLRSSTNSIRVFVAITLVLFVASFSYKGFTVSDTFINKLNDSIISESINEKRLGFNNAATDQMDNNIDLENSYVDIDEIILQDNRTKESLFKLSGRVPLWKATIATLLYEPERLLCGSLLEDYMLSVRIKLKAAGEKANESHTHNFLLETLMMTGLIGCLLMMIFVLLIARCVLKVFLSNRIPIRDKMLILPLVSTIVINMATSSLVINEDVTNYIFFLVAGIFLSYSYELFPEKKYWGRRKGKAQSANDASSTAIDEAEPEQTVPEQVTL